MEKKTGHIYFNEEKLLHAISNLRYVQFHVVVVHTTRDQKTRQGFQLQDLNWVGFGVLDRWSLKGGSRTWRFNCTPTE